VTLIAGALTSRATSLIIHASSHASSHPLVPRVVTFDAARIEQCNGDHVGR
jgi:hypothetical protein